MLQNRHRRAGIVRVVLVAGASGRGQCSAHGRDVGLPVYNAIESQTSLMVGNTPGAAHFEAAKRLWRIRGESRFIRKVENFVYAVDVDGSEWDPQAHFRESTLA